MTQAQRTRFNRLLKAHDAATGTGKRKAHLALLLCVDEMLEQGRSEARKLDRQQRAYARMPDERATADGSFDL